MAEKQKAHPSAEQETKDVVNKLDKMREDIGAETYKSAAERSKQPGNPNKTPPEERTIQIPNRAADIAANHLSAASSAIRVHERSEAAMKADPRFERDQKVYEMGQQGRLGLVPPSELEMAARNVPEAESDAAPKDAKDQVQDDMKRLDEANKKAETQGSASTKDQPKAGTPIPPK